MQYASVINELKDLGSKKWLLHKEARQKIACGIHILELTIGEPDVSIDPALINQCFNSMREGRTQYSNGRGESNLLEQIAIKYNKDSFLNITSENVLCFPGTQTALYASIRAVAEKGDEVIVGDPMYATYEGIIKASGANMTTVRLHAKNNFAMQPEDLEKAISSKTRALILNSPHNPTGAVMTEENFKNIAELCIANDLWIISDEVYEDLIFFGEFFSPRFLEALANRTVTVSSISKSHAAPGFRSGWAVGNRDFCSRLLPLSETMLFGNQPFIADMTAFALSKPSTVVAQMKADYYRRAKMFCRRLKSNPKLVPLMPQAGMFILLNISQTNLSCFEFAWKLLEEKNVALMPGDSFGNEARELVRISLTVPDNVLEDACDRILQFVNEIE